jgi:hypothetical protein
MSTLISSSRINWVRDHLESLFRPPTRPCTKAHVIHLLCALSLFPPRDNDSTTWSRSTESILPTQRRNHDALSWLLVSKVRKDHLQEHQELGGFALCLIIFHGGYVGFRLQHEALEIFLEPYSNFLIDLYGQFKTSFRRFQPSTTWLTLDRSSLYPDTRNLSWTVLELLDRFVRSNKLSMVWSHEQRGPENLGQSLKKRKR